MMDAKINKLDTIFLRSTVTNQINQTIFVTDVTTLAPITLVNSPTTMVNYPTTMVNYPTTTVNYPTTTLADTPLQFHTGPSTAMTMAARWHDRTTLVTQAR